MGVVRLAFVKTLGPGKELEMGKQEIRRTSGRGKVFDSVLDTIGDTPVHQRLTETLFHIQEIKI